MSALAVCRRMLEVGAADLGPETRWRLTPSSASPCPCPTQQRRPPARAESTDRTGPARLARRDNRSATRFAPTRHSWPVPEHAGLWSPSRRALTIGLVLNVTIVASEALAVVDDHADRRERPRRQPRPLRLGLLGVLPRQPHRHRHRRPPHRSVEPGQGLFVLGFALFSPGCLVGGLAPSMQVLVAGRVLQGARCGRDPGRRLRLDRAGAPGNSGHRMFATLSTAWVLPGVIGPTVAGIVAQAFHWRVVFLGLLPLIAVAAAMTIPAMAAVGPAAAASGEAEASTSAAVAGRLFACRSHWSWRRRRGDDRCGSDRCPPGAGPAAHRHRDRPRVPGVPAADPCGHAPGGSGLPSAVLLRGFLTFAFFAADAYVALALEDWRGTERGRIGTGPHRRQPSPGRAGRGSRPAGSAGWARRVRPGRVCDGRGRDPRVRGDPVTGRPDRRRRRLLGGCRSRHGLLLLAAVTPRPARRAAREPGDRDGRTPAVGCPRDVAGDRCRWRVHRARSSLDGADGWVGLAWAFGAGMGAVVAVTGFRTGRPDRPGADRAETCDRSAANPGLRTR